MGKGLEPMLAYLPFWDLVQGPYQMKGHQMDCLVVCLVQMALSNNLS
jgi:hypothetical protein